MQTDPDVTIGFKTFLRPKKLQTCLQHLSRMSPRPAEVIVADDSLMKELNRGVYAQFEDALPLRVLDLEPDAGVCAGRNRIVDRTETEYLLVMDDDHYLPEDALRLKHALEGDASLGGIAASAFQDGFPRIAAADMEVHDGWLIIDAPEDKRPESVAGLECYRYDFVPFCTLFRMETLDDYRWDEAYVIDGEHADFYYGHATTTDWEFAITPDIRVHHDPGPGVIDAYADHRMSDRKRRESREYFAEKWGLRGYLIREFHDHRYESLTSEIISKTLYSLPPVVHWELKRSGALDRVKHAFERFTDV